MSRPGSESLLCLTESFFHNYLQRTCGASSHTIRAYRDALKLFFMFLANQRRKSMSDLALDDIRCEAVLSFLDHVESQRRNSAATRNCRLAAVRSFVHHLLRQDVTRAGQYGRILAIRNKKALRRTPTYLEPEEARAVIAAIDRRSRNGERDHALLLFLYNTGARVKRGAIGSSLRSAAGKARTDSPARQGPEGENLSPLVRNSLCSAPYYQGRNR